MAVTRETLRLQQQLRDDINQITDQTVRDLTAAWARAWDEVSLDLELALTDLIHAADGQRITRAMIIRTERLTRSLLVIQNRLERLAADAGVRITADLDAIVLKADELQVGIVASQLPPGEREIIDSWSTVDGRQLQAIVKRSRGAGSIGWCRARRGSVRCGMSRRVCAVSGCPETFPPHRSGKCPEHRATASQRGYDAGHQAERNRWAPVVAQGVTPCRRCRQPIAVNEPWDLGHPDADCDLPKAPEHRRCNRATAGR